MFDKFGEFDSVEELNRAAAGLKAEGDEEALIALALENGIEKEDAEDYLDGCMEELATVTMAAFGRIRMEEKEADALKNPMEKMAIRVIFTMLKGMCTDEVMAEAVVCKGKRVSEIFKAMKREAEKHKSGNMGMSCGTDRELCEIIRAYYMEPESSFKNRIKALY